MQISGRIKRRYLLGLNAGIWQNGDDDTAGE